MAAKKYHKTPKGYDGFVDIISEGAMARRGYSTKIGLNPFHSKKEKVLWYKKKKK